MPRSLLKQVAGLKPNGEVSNDLNHPILRLFPAKHKRKSSMTWYPLNLSLRMHLRRFTRLTNAFSKKLDNLKAAVCLWFGFYYFCRIHETLRLTPAMEAGITDHV
jgi:hypothetical protein